MSKSKMAAAKERNSVISGWDFLHTLAMSLIQPEIERRRNEFAGSIATSGPEMNETPSRKRRNCAVRGGCKRNKATEEFALSVQTNKHNKFKRLLHVKTCLDSNNMYSNKSGRVLFTLNYELIFVMVDAIIDFCDTVFYKIY